MLSKGDDFPIHQTAEPVAFSGTDRNFYDRYFFNGYTRDGTVFFAVALGVYPHLNIMDASFCVVVDGVQHNLHSSRVLGMERMDTQVGPIRIEVVEPLSCLRIIVEDNDYGVRADVTFRKRTVAIEEPRFTCRQGPRVLLDYTRLTQNGTYEGWIEVKGTRIDIHHDQFLGTRDRSWGIRPVGVSDPQPVAPPPAPQFYWIWAPLNFQDGTSLYHNNSDAQGNPWNESAILCGLNDSEPQKQVACSSTLTFRSGSRHVAGCVLHFEDAQGGKTVLRLTPQWHFYMMGLGYGNPDWGHGLYKGDLMTGYDAFRSDAITQYTPPYLHIQAFVEAEKTAADGSVETGVGVLEQLIAGPHEPSGFRDLLDPAP